ncbi:hypothetical protein PGT21_030757 [Puccinia graminis f. sp. tritici]|uniref:Ca2+:H+ antiporter n=1 Tax=Puccinia graminis f. sp. tritici TaxID=56615 RepID=A0A5B0QKC3_PUCGR|nr:hypothetical protein PGT21_030757 [Puccinia graminis f. sp. tritici]
MSTNQENNNNNKGKGKQTNNNQQQATTESIKQNKNINKRPTTTLTTDTFINPEPTTNSSSSEPNIITPTSTTNQQQQQQQPPSVNHPPKSTQIDTEEDDEVQPIDRGEALVRRRMKERQRLKKEAERRLRRAADEETRPTNNSSTIIPARPTTSRTKTAPSNSHHHHHHQQQQHHTTQIPNPGAHRDPRLASPSLESFWAPSASSANQQTETNRGEQQAKTQQSPETRSIIRLDIDHKPSSPAHRGVSPVRIQSTYQSFGSPSQFSAPIIKSSTSEQPTPTRFNQQTQQQPSDSAKSSFSLHGKNFQSNPPTVELSGSDFTPRRPRDEYDEDAEETEDGTEEEERLYDLSTPTVRGRAGIPKSLSVRSTSTAAHSLHRQSSRFSVAHSKSADQHRAESLSLLSNDDLPSQHSSVHTNKQIQEASHAEDDDNSEHQGSSSSSSPLDDDVEYTLKDRQDAINIEHPFGLPIWKPALYKKSRSVARNAEAALHNSPTSTTGSTLTFGNLLWSLIFGIWLAVVVALVAAILFVIPWGGSKYGRVVWELAGYLVWPFGKYVEEWSEEEEEEGSETQNEERADATDSSRFAAGLDPGAPHASRWVTVSEIDEDEVASIDRLTIRGGLDPEDERTGLTSERRSPNYGATSPSRPSIAKPKDRLSSDSTIKTDLNTILGIFKRTDGTDGRAKRQIRVRALGRLSFWVAYYLIIAPLMLTACLLCWFFVVTIPMAKLLWVLVQHIGTEPLALHFRSSPTYIDLHQVEIGLASGHNQEQGQQQGDGQTDGEPRLDENPQRRRVSSRLPPQLKPGQPAPKHSKKSLSESRAKGRLVSGKAKVLLCTYKALGLQYYKYTVDGVNIMFIILIPFVIFVILDFFFLAPLKLTGFLGVLSSQIVLFVMALLSVIPLSYFIGMAVASISAQSSIGMGAVINATFGSVIEIILYSIALTEGKGELVEGSIIGSVLAGVLLLPGLSMIGGSFKRKEQRFNARSAGVTSTMLIMAIIGTLTPTLFYEIYGTFQLTCSGCPDDLDHPGLISQDKVWKCKSCRYEHLSPVNDSFYQSSVKGLSYYCAGLLVLSYLIGLWFSLRTHASQIWQTPAAVLPHGPGVGGTAAGAGGEAPQSMAEHHHQQQHPGSTQEGHEYQHLTSQQRMSMYVRKLPEIVKQQLLPHLQRSISTTRHPEHHQPISSSVQSPAKAPPNEEDPSNRLPRTLTTEEVNQTLHVLQLASHGFPSRPPPKSRPSSQFIHSREPSHSHHRDPAPPSSGLPPGSSSHPLPLSSVAAPHVHHPILIEEHHSASGNNGGGGHDAPNWSRTKSTTVLLLCTALYAIIAEILVDVVDVVLDGKSKLPEKFLGISLFALVPNTTEFMNAISFAINGNIALSMEIGSAYALQVCLIQIPAMITFSSFYNSNKFVSASHTFTLVFPRWDVIAIIFSIFLLTYTYIEARSNYHRGTILVLSYLVLIGGFYSAPVDSLDALSTDINHKDQFKSVVFNHPLSNLTASSIRHLQLPPLAQSSLGNSVLSFFGVNP